MFEMRRHLPGDISGVRSTFYRFPPEVVAVDISGRAFDRLSVHRRSLLHTETEDGATVRRKGRTRKSRSRRRNTIAGTDQKELRDAVIGG